MLPACVGAVAVPAVRARSCRRSAGGVASVDGVVVSVEGSVVVVESCAEARLAPPKAKPPASARPARSGAILRVMGTSSRGVVVGVRSSHRAHPGHDPTATREIPQNRSRQDGPMAASGDSGIVVLVPDAEPVVDRWRQRHDGAARQGMPAHITLLYPFLTEARLDAAVIDRLRSICAPTWPIDLELRRTARFPATIYLAPSPPTSSRPSPGPSPRPGRRRPPTAASSTTSCPT